MDAMVNLLVELDARFDADARARALRTLDAAGYTCDTSERADERTLAWIDETFGGTWSGETAAGSAYVARRDGAPVGFAAFDARGLHFAWLRGLGTRDGVGIFGPFGVAPEHRGRGVGAALLTLALCALRARGYAQALIPAVGGDPLIAYYARACGAFVIEHFDLASFTPRPVRTVVMASGSGSNFQAVIDRVREGLPLDLTALVCNKRQAYAIERARGAGIEAVVLPWDRATRSRAQYDAELCAAVAACAPEMILLLGWMHLLDRTFVETFPELINVHPAYLPLDGSRNEVGMPDGSTIPAFRGAHAIGDALAAKSPWVGVSVHLVTLETDRGPILARKPLRVRADEAEATLMERVHAIEHHLVIAGIRRRLFER